MRTTLGFKRISLAHFLRTFALKHKTKITRMKRKLKVTRGPRLMVFFFFDVIAEKQGVGHDES